MTILRCPNYFVYSTQGWAWTYVGGELKAATCTTTVILQLVAATENCVFNHHRKLTLEHNCEVYFYYEIIPP